MAQHFRVGSFETDISPSLGTHLIGGMAPRPCVNIKDPTRAKAIVVDNGETQAALVTVDLCMAQREHLDRAKARLQERTGIAPENVLISATHTHTGPAAVSLLTRIIREWYAAMVVSPWGPGLPSVSGNTTVCLLAASSDSPQWTQKIRKV